MTSQALEELREKIEGIEEEIMELFFAHGGFEALSASLNKDQDSLLSILFTADAILRTAGDKIEEMIQEIESN